MKNIESSLVSKFLLHGTAKLTRQDVDESVLELVHRQAGADEFHWIHLHACQPLQHVFTTRYMVTNPSPQPHSLFINVISRRVFCTLLNHNQNQV